LTTEDDGPLESVLREVAEYPNSFGPLGPNDERIETDRYTLCMGPGKTWNTVQRQRFRAEQVEDVLEEVRSLLRARGRGKTQWEVGSSAEPANLVDLLLERGLIRDKDPFAVALVLTEPPAPVPGIVARRVETFEEYAAANSVQWQAFEMPEDDVAEARALLPQRWRDAPSIMHAAWLDGEIVSAGTCAPTPHGLLLYGGATVAQARGRGAYRALLRARWDEATGRGTPALITQGGSMSRPILERLGFEPVGHVHMLLDEFGRREA
jgi:GNAT superfamily N-acetyltransferase